MQTLTCLFLLLPFLRSVELSTCSGGHEDSGDLQDRNNNNNNNYKNNKNITMTSEDLLQPGHVVKERWKVVSTPLPSPSHPPSVPGPTASFTHLHSFPHVPPSLFLPRPTIHPSASFHHRFINYLHNFPCLIIDTTENFSYLKVMRLEITSYISLVMK